MLSGDQEGQCVEQDGKIEVIQKFVPDGEADRVCYMPQNPFLMITKTIVRVLSDILHGLVR